MWSSAIGSVVGEYALMMELDLRKLNHFVAVAEELNFTPAAERLGIGQQAQSASSRRLESELEVFLLVRSTRQVALTEAGGALLDVVSVFADIDGHVILAPAETMEVPNRTGPSAPRPMELTT
jgi:Bacterial regulatory helix-turn-helix protein, lysR family